MVRGLPHGCGLLRGQLVQMLQDAVDRAVPPYQLSGSDLAYAPDARNIVRSISPDGEDVDDLARVADAEFGADLLLSDCLVLRSSLAGLDLKDMVGDELAEVLVGGDHVHVAVGRAPAAGHGAYHVVGLVAGHHQDGYAEGPDYLGQRLQGFLDDLGGGAAGGLVFRVGLVAEGLARGVEGDRQMGGPFAGNHLEQIAGEPEDDRGVLAPGVDHRAADEGVVHPEHQGVAVYEEESVHGVSFRLRLFVVGLEPLDVGGGGLVQAERVQVYSGGQIAADDVGEVQDQVLAGGLERHGDDSLIG